MATISYLLFLHFVADFYLQDRETARKKSLELRWLAKHMAVLYTVFQLGTFLMLAARGALLPHYLATIGFSTANAVVHGVIDWYIWHVYRVSVILRYPGVSFRDFTWWEDHGFYFTIGFDQLLHALTLCSLYSLFPM
jgi:hypothetical protein